MPALRLHQLTRCTVYTGPVTGATFVNGMQDCKVMLASYQVRIHLTQRTDFYLRVRSRPIIEHTSDVRFAPYHIEELSLSQEAVDAKLSPEEDALWDQVEDFAWIKAAQSPNWIVLPEADRMMPVPPSVINAAQS